MLRRRKCRRFSKSGSLSDLTRRGIRGKIATTNSQPPPDAPHAEFPPHRPPDQLPDAALGRRVAAAETFGALRGGGNGWSGPERDEQELSRFGFGFLPPGGTAEPPGVRLRHRAYFRAANWNGPPTIRWRSASSPRTTIRTTTPSPRSGGGFSRRSRRCSSRCCCWRARWGCSRWARWHWMGPRSTPTPAATAHCPMSTRERSRRN